MNIIEESDFKSKVEFVLEYLDHHREIFANKILIYPENDETLKLKSYIEQVFMTEITLINKLKELKQDSLKFLIFNSNNHGNFKYLLDNDFNFKKILISSDIQVRGYRALLKTVEENNLKTVLDIGCGDGIQGRIFSNYGKTVTGINIGIDEDYNGKYLKSYGKVIIGDYLYLKIDEQYDIVWLSHILEHIKDVEAFLLKLKRNIKIGGTLTIIIPPFETDITLNHIHTFNTGRILRYLVISGYDCRDVCCFDYGYNKCIILKNIKFHNDNEKYIKTKSDIKKFFNYLPKEIIIKKLPDGNLIFDGNINKINC